MKRVHLELLSQTPAGSQIHKVLSLRKKRGVLISKNNFVRRERVHLELVAQTPAESLRHKVQFEKVQSYTNLQKITLSGSSSYTKQIVN